MPLIAFQDVKLVGSRFYYKKDDVGATKFPLIDLGVITPATPNFDIQKAELFDSDGGRRQLIAEAVTSITEEFTITCSNLNMENMAVLFMANRPETFSQSVSSRTNVVHYAEVGALVKIVNSSGVGQYMLSGVTSVTLSGGTTAIEFEIPSQGLDRGVIRILNTTANTTDLGSGANVDIDYAVSAISGKRIIKPQQLAGVVTGKGYLYHSAEGNARVTVREGRMSLTPAGGSFSDEEFSNMELTLRFLSDLTVTDPAGFLLNFKGTLPTVS